MTQRSFGANWKPGSWNNVPQFQNRGPSAFRKTSCSIGAMDDSTANCDQSDAFVQAQHSSQHLQLSGARMAICWYHAGTMSIWQYSGHIVTEAATDGSEASLHGIIGTLLPEARDVRAVGAFFVEDFLQRSGHVIPCRHDEHVTCFGHIVAEAKQWKLSRLMWHN